VSHPVSDIFRQAAEQIHEDPRRRGNTVWLDGDHELVVCGDLHGQRNLLGRVIHHAGLGTRPERILLLQELLHGPLDAATGKDRSIEVLMRAARLRLAHPDQVLLVLSNHDVAQITDREVSKEGRTLCRQFATDTISAFAEGGEEVLAASLTFLCSLPLAVRTEAGTFIAHSVPSPRQMSPAILGVLDRPTQDDDLRPGGAVYEWTWGRRQTAAQFEELAEQLNATFFLLSHRHLDSAYEIICPRAAAITSEETSGGIATFRADQTLTAGDIADLVTPLGLI